jgi:hypothetical protein
MRERMFKRFEVYYQLKVTFLPLTFNLLDFLGSQSHLQRLDVLMEHLGSAPFNTPIETTHLGRLEPNNRKY